MSALSWEGAGRGGLVKWMVEWLVGKGSKMQRALHPAQEAEACGWLVEAQSCKRRGARGAEQAAFAACSKSSGGVRA